MYCSRSLTLALASLCCWLKYRAWRWCLTQESKAIGNIRAMLVLGWRGV